jgi:cell division protein ZapA
MSADNAVAVMILDREFLIGCTPEERPGLIAAASYLDGKMREVRAATRAQGIERVAVLAALNITHEFLQHKNRIDSDSGAMAQHLQMLRNKLDGALATPVK